MKLLNPAIALLLITACQQNPDNMQKKYEWPDKLTAPAAATIPKSFTAHNDTRSDEYYWLNQRENPDVISYLEAENKYTDSMMSGTKKFQQDLYNEMKARIQEKDESVPFFKNGYWYYNRYSEGLQYAIRCRKKGSLEAAEEIMLDQNQLAKGFEYYQVGGVSVSDNNEILAYTYDAVSRRMYNLRFRNLNTGEDYPETIPNISGYDMSWAADNKHFFYILQDTVTLQGYQVWRHALGSDPKSDVLMYEEKDNRYSISLERSKSKKYIFLSSSVQEETSEYLLLPADKPTGSFTVFQPRENHLLYYPQHVDGKFFVLTNLDAPNFRVMETPESATAKANWKEVIPTSDSIYISGIELFKNFLVIAETKNALSQLRVINQVDKTSYNIPFDEQAYDASVNVNYEFNTDLLRFSYTSLTTPASIFDFNMSTKQRLLKKQTAVLGSFKKENYVSDRVWAPAKDGTKIPVTLVYRKGLKKDGKAPLLLYAYGSYGISMTPGFSSTNLSLLDRGFVYAIAHVRGGLDYGRKWYDGGKMMNKKNTFTDFIDCGEFLVKENYTSKEHLYAEGGSAGGLLMGAITNMRPDLWNGVIAQVPFVDVITTMSDTTIPLTTLEYTEWGNPNIESEYRYMKSYSPYDNVEKKAYPNLLVTTGLYDSQVQYFEPAKWVARLRTMNTGENKILFHINMAYGHGGASGRFDYLKDKALEFAFLCALEGISE